MTDKELEAWQINHIKAALAGDDAGGPAVAHEDVVRWMACWGTDNELPRPELLIAQDDPDQSRTPRRS